ncbi:MULTISPECIES: 5'/3'-nucleotidase SurE [unclassified Duganella]|uniref:5'/3'-nucleotidase SurE n=1 Tax=unclassified Duganella TaxID=2636909 RepID=UPI000E348DE2|nr:MULTISPECIES: 5'/3'-nucleotidase SurE [unclassified Duganella]RFP10609.1 acid phosphatase [Duganella sp. BJB475]RFP27362.1 acid phosphatase [Duganella sp. BJB476]
MPSSLFNSAARAIALCGVFALPAAPASALNILLCNDDGITAANLRALKTKLIAAGHSVAVAAPIDNQSGRGGYIAFLTPIGALTGKERGALALGLAAGAPGVGVDAGDADVSYVNGTPVAACLYGVDVLAKKKWGGAPDLVISGPNEGNNTGAINASSGTFNNLVYMINRGLPAMAVSDATTTQVTWSAALPASHRVYEVAGIVVKLVDTLIANKAKAGGLLMPEGVGLNVNVPDFSAGAGAALPYRFTRIGKASSYLPAFYEKLSDSPLAVASGVNFPVPGISLATGGTVLPSGVTLPKDTAATSEDNVIATKTAVTISPVEGVPQARRAFEDAMKIKLNGIAQ